MSEIRELFDQNINRHIEKVIQYQTTEEEKLRQEVSEYIVTDSIERSIERMLDSLDNGFSSPSEEEVGVWVSGFYGSGKSSITKYLGYALDDSVEIGGTKFRDLFRSRITNGPLQQRLVTVGQRHNPAVLAIDLSSASRGELISSEVFRRVLIWAGFSRIAKHALLELQVEEDGRATELHEAVRALGYEWSDIRNNEIVGGGIASQAASQLYPNVFPDQEAFEQLRIDKMGVDDIVRRMLELVERRHGDQQLIVILDEAGQYAASREERVGDLQGLAQNFKAIGKGRAWIIATAQQTLTDTVDPINATRLFKLKDRFPVSIELKADDIKVITYKRLLSKTQGARETLAALYEEHGSKLNIRTELEKAKGYPTAVDKEGFIQLYPFLPQHFDLMMNIISRLAKSTGGTGLRSAIKVVQETLIGAFNGEPFASQPVGRLVTIVDFFDVLRQDMESAPAFKHTVRAVEKSEQRYGRDSAETRVAKAVAVMQVLDDFPLNRHNLAALLVSAVDEASNEEEINAAVDTLRDDQSVPLEEIEGRLWFLSDRSAELQREWRDIQPGSNDERQVLADVLREFIQTSDPRTTVYGTKQVRASVSLVYGGYQRSLRSGQGDLEVEFRFVSPNDFAGERESAQSESLKPEAARKVVALAALDPATKNDIRDAYASSKMRTDLRKRTLDGDEDEFYRSLDDRNRTARQRIADAMSQALTNGSVIYHGQNTAVKHAASSFDAALTNALTEVGKEVFSSFPHAAVKPNEGAAEKIVKASDTSILSKQEDPLNLFGGGQGDAFNDSAPAVVDVKDYVRNQGSVKGSELLDDFARPPYGWNKDVTRYVIAAMFRASHLALRINGDPVTTTTQAVIDGFKSNRAFGQIGVEPPPEPPEQEVMLRAQQALSELTGSGMKAILRDLEVAARGVVPAVIASARNAESTARALGLAVADEAREAAEQLKNLEATDQNALIRAFGQADRALFHRIKGMQKLEEALSGHFGDMLRRLRAQMQRIESLADSGVYGALKRDTGDLREEIASILGEDSALLDRQAQLQDLSAQLESYIQKSAADEREHLAQDAPRQASEIEHSADWNDLDESARERFARRLEELRQSVPPEKNDSMEELASLYTARFELATELDEVKNAVHEHAEAVRKDQKVTELNLPGGVLSGTGAREQLEELSKQLEGLDEESQVRFRVEN